MERFWNFLFYATWLTLSAIRLNLITNPIHNVMVKIYPKKRKTGLRNYRNYIKSDQKLELKPESSSSIHFAFEAMLFSTSIVIGVALISLNYLFDFQVENGPIYSLIGTVIISIFMNYYFLYQNDKYLNYFKSFKSQGKQNYSFLISFLIHVVPFIAFYVLILKK